MMIARWHTASRYHVDDAFGLLAVTRHQVQAEPLHHHGHYEQRLHGGHVGAHAQPRSTTEREICVARPGLRHCREKALRIERLRVLPELGIPVGEIRTEQDR